MVGVPGMSRGCITCRKRKKGCDKSRPVCQRCVKAGLPCSGYSQDLTWVSSYTDEKGDTTKEQAKLADTNKSLSSMPPWKKRYAAPSSSAAAVALPESLVRSAREQLYFGLLTSIMLPGGRQYSSKAMKYASVGWTNYVPVLYDTEPALRLATVAMSISLLAEDNLDTQLRIKGLQTYNHAVFQVAKALQLPDWFQRDGLLAATRMMASYELLFPPTKDSHMLAWRGHSEGQQAMFLTRGPEAFSSGAAHQMFVDARINMIMLAIGRRRRSPFSTSKWTYIPWSVNPKSIKDELLDIMQAIPTILEQVEAFRTLQHKGTTTQLRKRILADCDEIDAKLAAWGRKATPDILTFDYTETYLDNTLPAPLRDSDFALLHLSIIYWFTHMILYSIMIYFDEDGSKSPHPSDELSDSGSTGVGTWRQHFAPKSPDLYAAKCCHVLNLFFDENGGVIEGTSGLLALSIALRFFLNLRSLQEQSVEVEKLRAALELKVLNFRVGDLLERIFGGKIPMESASAGRTDSEKYIKWF